MRQGRKRCKDLLSLSIRITASNIEEYDRSKAAWTQARNAMYAASLRRARKALNNNKRNQNHEIEVSGITSRGASRKLFSGGSGVLQIAAGSRHAVAISETGRLYSWGVSTFGRLGSNLALKQKDQKKPQLLSTVQHLRFKMVSCGYSHSAACTWDGQLMVWGSACTGKLGLQVPAEFECFAVSPSIVVLPGVSRCKGIRKISCGAGHTAAVTEDGQLFIWGWYVSCTRGLNEIELPRMTNNLRIAVMADVWDLVH